MAVTITEDERRKVENLRQSVANVISEDLNTDLNISRWIDRPLYRFREYLANRRAAGFVDTNFMAAFFQRPIITSFAPYFSFTASPNVINPIDNNVLIMVRLKDIDLHEMANVMTCGECILFYFTFSEWCLQQVLKQEKESGKTSAVTVVIDLDQFSPLHYVNPTSAIRRILTVCGRVAICDVFQHVMVLNSSGTFKVFMHVMKNYMDVKKRVIVVGKQRDLPKYIHPSVLPVHYGGQRTLSSTDSDLIANGWKIDPSTCAIIARRVKRENLRIPKKYTQKVQSQQINSKGHLIIPLKMRQIGTIVRWQFRTTGEILLAVVQKFPSGDEVDVIPRWSLITPKLPEEGHFACKDPGDYVFKLINQRDGGCSAVKLDLNLEFELPS